MTEWQGAILRTQMTRLEGRSAPLGERSIPDGRLKEIAGISPARLYEGCTRSSYHLYMFRYDERIFGLAGSALEAARSRRHPFFGRLFAVEHGAVAAEQPEFARVPEGLFQAELANTAGGNNCPANDKLC